jgi:hypothetical protein
LSFARYPEQRSITERQHLLWSQGIQLRATHKRAELNLDRRLKLMELAAARVGEK